MNLFSTEIETGGHILKLNDAINRLQHNHHLLTDSVVNAQKRVISPTELMTVLRRREGQPVQIIEDRHSRRGPS